MAGAKVYDFIVAVGAQHISQFIQRYYFLAHQYLLWLTMKGYVKYAVVFVFFQVPLVQVIGQVFARAAVPVYVIDIAVSFQKLQYFKHGVLFFQIFTPVAFQAKYFFYICLGKLHLTRRY